MPVLLPGMNASMAIPDGMGRAMIRFPAAIPINLLPLLLRSPEISTEDLAILKEQIFTPDLIGNVLVDYSTFLATFRGKPYVSTIETYERYAVCELMVHRSCPGLFHLNKKLIVY
jgi:hypothetical protein